MDKNDIINYVMHTPHNTNRAVLSSMLNQLTEGGGGGSSDFSTAEVTVVNNADNEVSWGNCPTLNLEYNLLIGSFYLEALSSITVLVPLYKGKVLWDIGSKGLILSGNIEDFENGLIITGDGTITIS